MDNNVGVDCGSRGWAGWRRAKGNIGTTVIESQFKKEKE